MNEPRKNVSLERRDVRAVLDALKKDFPNFYISRKVTLEGVRALVGERHGTIELSHEVFNELFL